MATKVPIGIFQISRTQVNREAVRKWLEFIGVSSEFELPPEELVSNPALLIAIAGKRCYKSFEPGLNPNVTKIRKDWGDYLDNILKSGHGSVLEHSVFSYAIENISRVFTGEMNRHRAGWAISEGSMRFIRFSEAVPYWEPDSIKGPDVLHGANDHALRTADLIALYDTLKAERTILLPTVDHKMHATRVLFERAFDGQRDMYKLLELIWEEELAPESKFAKKKQLTSLFRRIIGMGCATGGVWTGNVRALRHVITMRAAPEAEEEILHVFSRIAKEIVEQEPYLFGDFVETDGFWAPKYRKV
jgi:thymidylate synthase (FAD)